MSDQPERPVYRFALGRGERLIVLEGSDALIAWVKQEREHWKDLADRFDADPEKNRMPGEVSNAVRAHLQRWDSYLARLKSDQPGQFNSGASALQAELQAGDAIAAESSVGLRILSAADKSPALAALVVALYTKQLSRTLRGNGQELEAVWRELPRLVLSLGQDAAGEATAQASDLLTTLSQNAAQSNEALDTLLQSIKRKEAETNESLSSYVSSANENLKLWHEDAAEQLEKIRIEWAALRKTYDADIKFKAARKYWQDKADEHSSSAKWWRGAFLLVGTVGVILLAVLFWLTWAQVQVITAEAALGWIFPAVVLGVPSFLILWMLRVCGRQFSDHLLREEDAKQRAVMVETFLALARSEDSASAIASEAQVAIVLNALYRPGPGLAADDAPPSSIIEAFKNATMGQQRAPS